MFCVCVRARECASWFTLAAHVHTCGAISVATHGRHHRQPRPRLSPNSMTPMPLPIPLPLLGTVPWPAPSPRVSVWLPRAWVLDVGVVEAEAV